MAKDKKVIKPKPVKGYPVTQPDKKRPSLGSGQAEKAAQSLEGRGSKIDRAVSQATGNADKKGDKQQGKADKG